MSNYVERFFAFFEKLYKTDITLEEKLKSIPIYAKKTFVKPIVQKEFIKDCRILLLGPKEYLKEYPKYTVDRLDYTEELRGNMKRKTFYVDFPTHEDELLILSFAKDRVVVNTAIMADDKISISKKPMPLKCDSIYSEEEKEIKDFNYKHIYTARKIKPAIRYFSIVLNEIYFTLKSTYDGKNTAYKMRKLKKMYPEVVGNFQEWLENYWNQQRKNDNQNDIIVNMDDEKSFSKAIIYYISGMTDNFAIDTYNKIIGF